MEEQVLSLLEELCEDEVVREDLDINLRDEGLLDSLGFVEMLVRMEEVFGFATAPTTVTYEEIDTPRRVIAYVKKRVAALWLKWRP